MRLRSSYLLAMSLGFVFGPCAIAQIPGGASAGGQTATATQGAKQAGTVWEKLGLSQEKLAIHRKRWCKSGLGRLLKSMFAPIKLATGGGLLPPCCPDTLSEEDLKKLTPENSPASVSAAAKIKAEEAKAKERVAAVKYLATVDCHYWPEAEEALIAGLRADRNECVRFAAAQALLNGCCCTKKTVAALEIVVSGSEKDGNPYEKSERVKQVAFRALHKCIAKMGGRPEPQPPEPPLAEPQPPEKSAKNPHLSTMRPVSWIAKKQKPRQSKQVGHDALRVYAANVGAPTRRPGARRTPRNLLDLWKAAIRSAPPELPSATNPVNRASANAIGAGLRPISEMPLMLPEANNR